MLEINLLIFLYLTIFQSTLGLICWECNSETNAECLAIGQLMSCDSHDEACFTVTKKQNNKTQIVKGCKEIMKCIEEQKQNWLLSDQCKDAESSECHCCCFENYCNVEENCVATTHQKCQPFRNDFEVGRCSCTNFTNPGSVCTFDCLQKDHVVQPPISRQLQCLPNGKWDKPIPCCGAPTFCPPVLHLDLVVLMHVKDQATYDFTLPVTKLFLDQVEFGSHSLRYSLMYFSGSIHEPLLEFSETTNMSSATAWEKINNDFFFQRTEEGSVNTGAALRHVQENIFGSGLDRDSARNCIVLITDENSDDDVTIPAAELRKDGVMIFNYFFQARETDFVDRRQLYDVSGRVENTQIVSPEGRFEVTSDVIMADFFHKLCPVTCDSFMGGSL